MTRIAILLHDGFYGCGTGAGPSNHSLLRVITRQFPDATLRLMPVGLAPSSAEYNTAWYTATRTLFTDRQILIHPIDNGTHGQTRFGGLTHFRIACTAAANHLNTLPSSEQPELLIALDTPFHGLAPLLTPRLAGRTLLVPRSTGRLHAPDTHDRITWEHRGFTELAVAGGHIAAISAYMRTHLASAYQVPDSAIVDMPNALTREERFHNNAPLLPSAASGGFLLSIGRAIPYKGFDDLLDALHHLRQVGVAVPHLVLAAVTDTDSPSDYQRHLARRIRALRVDATLLTRYDPDLPGLYSHPAMRGIVVPSRVEPFGRIPLEAFAVGAAPVIATTAGGLAETVTEGITGFTAAPCDPESLASAIDRALALRTSEVNVMRANGVRAAHARDYDLSVLAALAHIAPRLLRTRAAGTSQSV